MSMREARMRAALGRSLLDAVEPTWRSGIDLDDLDMGDERFCVVGQAYGGFFSRGADALFPDGWTWAAMREHGFEAEDGVVRYEELEAAWREIIDPD